MVDDDDVEEDGREIDKIYNLIRRESDVSLFLPNLSEIPDKTGRLINQLFGFA